MDITKLEYSKPKYKLETVGVLFQMLDDDIMSEMFAPFTFDTYIRKVLCEDEEFVYHVNFRVGYAGFVPFYSKSRSMRMWFLMCKDYHVTRQPLYDMSDDSLEVSAVIKDNREEREAFADEYGPLVDTYYDENTYTDYAKRSAKK